ncbi:MAG: LETM1-related biofilm-associated protein [Leeuwenhoekiella sp.]
MNPSVVGWIDKQLILLNKSNQSPSNDNIYKAILESGFIYGISINLITPQPRFLHEWTIEEKTKVNLFDGLAYIYMERYNNLQGFTLTALNFYQKLLGINEDKEANQRKVSNSLEKIIHDRIKTNDSLLQKTFSATLINALLYIDIITFDAFVKNEQPPLDYASKFEFNVLGTISLATSNRHYQKGKEKSVFQLFQKSLRYHSFHSQAINSLESLQLQDITKNLEKDYLIDLSSLILYDERLLNDKPALNFLQDLAEKLNFSKEKLADSQAHLNRFMTDHKSQIPFFSDNGPFKNLYDHTSNMVHTVVLRNKKRLSIEISNNKDLLLLLGKSTYKDLNREERKRIKSQLLDICKTVPSLAVFLLPGGSLLLPLLIHFIPELLPSIFDENRIESAKDDDLEL